MFSYDTETTGTDLWHGCLPFFFAITHSLPEKEEGLNEWYEWDVDPFTRQPKVNYEELNQLCDCLCSGPVVMHNANFDILATEKILQFAKVDYSLDWLWENIEDTCIASHVLENLWSHSLKELRNSLLLIDDYRQNNLRIATNHARRIVRTKTFIKAHGEWRIADSSDPHWPAVDKAPKEKNEEISGWWYLDTWLPRAIATLAPEFLPKENQDGLRNSRPTKQGIVSLTSDRCIDNDSTRQTQIGEEYQRRYGKHGQRDTGLLPPTSVHSWHTVLRDYALEDSESTIVLWELLQRELEKAGLWEQYTERKRLLKVTHDMVKEGVTVTPQIHTDAERYINKAKTEEEKAVKILSSGSKKIAKPAIVANKHKEKFDIDITRKGKWGNPFVIGIDGDRKEVCQKYKTWLPTQPKLLAAIHELRGKRLGCVCKPQECHGDYLAELANDNDNKKPESPPINIRSDKQLQKALFQDRRLPILVKTETGQPSVAAPALKALWLMSEDEETSRLLQSILLSRNNEKAAGYLSSYRKWATKATIHPSINITGTKFTRQSLSSPNLQNIGTGKELADGQIDYNLREDFGPLPGNKWLSYDYSNIELRIWGYECGNKEFIWCFENDTPVHYLIACELHPELKNMPPEIYKEDKRYKRTKNGNFAIIYGSSPNKADITYGVPGAYERLSKRFPEVRQFTEKLFGQVKSRGYIETLTGYRLHIPYNDPHKSVSGKVQGTAGAIIGRAMSDCHEALESRPELKTKMILQIHDELVFKAQVSNPYDQEIKELIRHNMEKQGERIGIPLPVGGKEHLVNWSDGTAI